jgi:UDP-N-acetylglucosamine 2-epimerase
MVVKVESVRGFKPGLIKDCPLMKRIKAGSHHAIIASTGPKLLYTLNMSLSNKMTSCLVTLAVQYTHTAAGAGQWQ